MHQEDCDRNKSMKVKALKLKNHLLHCDPKGGRVEAPDPLLPLPVFAALEA